MKKTAKYISAFLVASSLSIGGALAGGSLNDDPYSAWSGFYAGLHAGYVEASYDGVFDINGSPEAAFASDLDLNGLVAGVHIGYNWQHNNIVIGIEADVSGTGLSDTTQDRVGDDDLISGDINFLTSLRGRLGFTTGSTLVYATGGIAYADATYTATDTDGDTSTGSIDFDDFGYVVGAGVEKNHKGIRLRLEGLYYSFDDKVDTSDLASTDSDDGDFAKFEDVWTIRAGISVPFGN